MPDSWSEETERQWIAKIQKGDREAFKKLFHVYYGRLRGFVRSRISDTEAAEDIVQDIFLDVWRRRHRFAPRSLDAYLFGAARNKSIKEIERRRVRREWKQEESACEPERGARPEEEFHYRELDGAMQDSVSELPERRRQVYVLSRRYGLTYKEIAEVMDISPQTVESQMVKALKFLRKRLRRFLLSVL